jgi:cellulose synthase (UDP-forming)
MTSRLFGRLIGHPVTLIAVIIAAISTSMLSIDAVHLFTEAFYHNYIDICIKILVLYIPMYFMIFGAMSYLITRYGLFSRNDESSQQSLTEMLPRIYGSQRRRLAILVPSYREEEKVIRQTLISAALVEYPGKRVVLLIDDPPFPTYTEDKQKLAAARRTVDEMGELFRTPCEMMKAQSESFLERQKQKYIEPAVECRRLAHLYEESARWLEEQAVRLSNAWGAQRLEPADQFFIDHVLIELARTQRQRASEVTQSLLSLDQISLEYCRLASLYDTAFSSFERKRYTNLSHAPNKAMNLNSYISLLGETVREVERGDGLYIERAGPEDGTIDIPQADYIINLDADTLLLTDYVIRLIDVMEQPGNERLAVAQTPYLAFPNPTSMVERIAGATTDVQYLTHQGMTFFNATSWVGANALIRWTALDDIATSTVERGHRLKVYIQDTTLIEDTAASIDLIHRKWYLYNYQARLAFSATPRDFGTLIIQRHRWANGGILIFPNLLRYSFQRPFSLSGLAESIVRSNYLLGQAFTSVGMLVLLVCSFDDYLFSLWVPLVAIPYQIVYGLDLRLAGHRLSDMPRVYALNMMLIPVCLGGTMQSILQAFTHRKTPFRRTPKVDGRTSTPLRYLAFFYGLLAWCGLVFVGDLLAGRTYHMIFTSINSAAYLYGVVRFIGIRESWKDVAATLRLRNSDGRRRPTALSGQQAANAKAIRA